MQNNAKNSERTFYKMVLEVIKFKFKSKISILSRILESLLDYHSYFLSIPLNDVQWTASLTPKFHLCIFFYPSNVNYFIHV